MAGIWVGKYEISDPQEATGFLSTSTEDSITVTSITVKGQSKADAGSSGDFASRTDITVSIEGTSNSETGKLPITFKELQPNKEYTIKVVIPDVMGDIELKKKVRTTEGSIKDVTAPDLSGFNENNTYYATFNDANGTIGKNITTTDDSLVDGRKIALDPPSDWYNYDSGADGKKWANIVTMNENGEACYFTWVPRYEYKINDELNSIDIVYITANRKEPDEGYQIPDAFTFDGKELSGLWVGKYEITDVAIPTGFNIQSIDGGFKITEIVYNNSCIKSGMPNNGTMVIKQNGSQIRSTSVAVGGTVKDLAAGVYTVEWTLDLGYDKQNKTKNYKTITKEIAVKSSVQPETPDLSGFNNSNTYAYYVTFGTNLNSLDDMKVGERVTFDNSGKANNMPAGWYDYDSKKWANIVVSNTPIEVGSKVNSLSEIKDLTVWVWVPRYEYRVDGSVSVVFLPKGGSADSGYSIPDAFKFDNSELSGIWVGKYEIEQQLSE